MKGSQSSLRALSFEPTLARLFATTAWAQVEALSAWAGESDPYRERDAIGQALAMVDAGVEPSAHMLHQYWATWRQAAWTSGLAAPLEMTISGGEHLDETEGHPTLLVTAMTLAPADAINAIARLRRADRQVVVFGEDMEDETSATTGVEIVTGLSGATVRRILEVLEADGILCTYPDFVYDYRSSDAIQLFGTERSIASGFVSLAARDGTMLLPLLCRRTGSDSIVVEIDEPVEVVSDAIGRDGARALILATIQTLLDDVIRKAPEQWLLLPTLTFESPQMASASAAARTQTNAEQPAPVVT